MSSKANIITTKIGTTGIMAIVLALAPAVFAHGGFDHVIGTVVQVTNNVLTVKTTKGNVDVKLDEKTEISNGDRKALKADLKPGLRVIVDIPEGSKDMIAHSVKVGAAGAATHADHDAH